MRLPRELFGNPPRRHAQVILIRQRFYAWMQRPFKMGVQSIISLKEATEGKKIENVDRVLTSSMRAMLTNS
jgi:hypothetical protein